MNDETEAAVERLRRRTEAHDTTSDEDAILAHIDGEPARLAAAREEQREACAQYVGAEFDLDVADQSVRRTPLDATPLADELEALRKERDDLALDLRGVKEGELVVVTTAEHDELRTLRARAAELEAQVSNLLEVNAAVGQDCNLRADKAEAALAEAHERLDEFGLRRDGTTATLVEGIAAMRTRIDEYRADWYRAEAQVAAARAVCGGVPPDDSEDIRCFASEVLLAMDEASTTK